MARTRVGAPTRGEVVATGTPNNLDDPKIVIFSDPVRPCLVTNHGTLAIRIKVNTELNGVVSETFSQVNGHGHILISGNFTQKNVFLGGEGARGGGALEEDVSLGGQISVHSVSVVVPGGAPASTFLDQVSVVGWNT